jgi:lysophospholipase L1-like esterase
MKRTITFALLMLLAACESGTTDNPQPLNQPRAELAGPVVFIGDSITQVMPTAEYVPGSVNLGVSGNETGQMLARFDDVLTLHPSVVVILGGTNDIRNRDSADPENLFLMVRRALDADARVIVGTLPPADINLGAHPEVERQLFIVMSDKIREGAMSHGYDVADYEKAILDHGGLIPSLYADKYLHPSRAGYDAMWSELKPVLERLTHKPST